MVEKSVNLIKITKLYRILVIYQTAAKFCSKALVN